MIVKGLVYSSGHTDKLKGDLGAISPNKKEVEGFLTVEAKNILTKYTKLAAEKEGITDLKLLVDRDDTALAETMQFLKGRTLDTDVLLDIHFNCADGKVKGTEVLIPEEYTSTELEIADRISDIIGNVLGTKERGSISKTDGVKTEADSARKKLGWMRIPGINILIEVEFLDNVDAMQTYHRNKETVWKLVAEYLVGLYKTKYMTEPILDLFIDTHNGFSLGVSDFSQYPTNFSIISPSLEITAPGFVPVNISFEPNSINIYTSQNIGITCSGEENVELPDGIYNVKYTISPAYQYFVERSFIRVVKLQEKFDTAFMKLDILQCDGPLRKQRDEELNTINFYIQGSIAAANKCAPDLAIKLYKKADKMLNYFITNKCNC